MKSQTQKTRFVFLLSLFFTSPSPAVAPIAEKLKKLPELPAKTAQELLYQLTLSYISRATDTDHISTNKNLLLTALERSNISHKKAFAYEIEALAAKKLRKLEVAKRYILLALKETGEGKPQLPRLLNTLAFIETDFENYMGAMESYLMAGKIFQKNRDTNRLIVNYSNIADLYIKNNLYEEAINALNQATTLAVKQKKGPVPYFIYQNKATTYFYLQNLDSLQYYAKKTLGGEKSPSYNIIAEHRLRYMELFLKKDPAVIEAIKLVLNNIRDQDYIFTTIHLARAYLLFDRSREAKTLIFKLLSSPNLKDPGYTRSILYDLLGDAYQKERNFQLSSRYYEKGMDQSLLNSENMMKTGSILTFLKYDEIKNKYVLAEENLKVRKNYFILLTVVAAMIIIALFLLYRSARMKKKYNELMYNKLNKEISFMNSHEVRRYLSNIQGIIMVIQMSEDKKTTYTELEEALFDSAENLDNSIKDIVNKLHHHTESTYQHTGEL
jgi:tetratricopeptide (TPR) repeat protein